MRASVAAKGGRPVFTREHHAQLSGFRRNLFGYACALCADTATAEDLYQDTLVRAMSARAVPADGRAFRVWMFRILRNLWIDRIRTSVREEESNVVVDFDSNLMMNGEEVTINRIAVRQAFTRLEKHHQDVLALVDVGGFSYEETAQLLDLPRGTVMSRVSRARAALAHELRDERIVALPVRRGRA